MIRMCELHQIDLILTKSVSRFARNVKEALSYTRKLKLLGVGVQFEEDGVNTLAMADEMLLNTFAAIAQEESKSISQNQRLSIVKRMELGEYIDSNAPYGYRLINKTLSVYEPEAIIVRWIYEEAAAVKSARRWNQAAQESEGIRQIRDRVRCGQCGAPMLRHINSKRAIRESWTCSNAGCGIRVRVSDGELLRKITLLMNRVIANADLMLPHSKVMHRDSAVVLNLQQQISDEMEQERPSEDRIATLLCEIAGQLYKETNAKTQIAAQIARKRASLMKLQDAFNAAYFSELIDAVSLHVGGGVVLHTKTETDICESEEEPNGSTENPKADSHPD